MEINEVLKEIEDTIQLHLSGDCGFKMCDECAKCNDEQDDCLLQCFNKVQEIKKRCGLKVTAKPSE